MLSPLTQRWTVLAILALSSSGALATDQTWTGADGGIDWVNPGNWSTAVPTALDSALIGADASGEKLIGISGNVTREVQTMTFLPSADTYQITGDGAGNALQFNAPGIALSNDSATRQTFRGLLVQAGSSQTWDGKANGLSFNQVSLGSGNTVTFSGTGNTATTRNELIGTVTSFPGSAAGIVKAGSGTLYIGDSATLSYTGATTVSQGTILLGGAELLPDDSTLVLGGGTLDIAGFDETTGKLSLAGNSTINFGVSGATKLVFDASQVENWGAFTLTILNFTPGEDTLQFGNSASGLTEGQLANIRFDGVTAAQINSDGFVSPVPEPSAALLIGIGALVAGGFRRRRAA